MNENKNMLIESKLLFFVAVSNTSPVPEQQVSILFYLLIVIQLYILMDF